MRRAVDSAEDMVALGRGIASTLRAGDVVALAGGLGAGKTHCAMGVAAGLGFDGPVTSPTFALLHEYPAGRGPVRHLDFYRVGSAGEAIAAGLDEWLPPADGVTLAEWADRFPELIPDGSVWITIEDVPDVPGRRMVTVRDGRSR